MRPLMDAQTPRTANDGVATTANGALTVCGSSHTILTVSGIFTPGKSFLCSRAADSVSISS